MATKIAEATLVLSIEDRDYRLALDAIPKQAKKAADDVKSISQAVNFEVFKELGKVAYESFAKITEGIIALGERGANVDDVANSFEILTAKTGETADVMIGQLRAGVVGTLSDYDLMTLANKTLGAGLVKTAEDMGTLAAGARALAKGTGGTTKEAFDTLTSAIASGRTATLKQIGAFVDSKVALENYAAAHKTSVGELTDFDRAQALAGASLAALRNRMKEVVPDAADFGELIEQAKVRLENFKDQVAVGIAKSPVFAAAMRTMGKALDDAFGKDQKQKVTELTKLTEDFVIGLTYVAQAAMVLAQGFVTSFALLEVLTNGALQVVYGLGASIMYVIDAMAKLLVIGAPLGEHFKGMAAKTTELRDSLHRMQMSFADSTAEAGEAVIGQGALQGKLLATNDAILKVRDAMYAAKGKTSETTKALTDLGKAAPEAAGRSQEAADKIAEAFRALNADIVIGTKAGLEKRLAEISAARDKELAGLKTFKDMTVAEHDEMERLINEKYDQRVQAARLAGDELVNKEREVQQAIALSLTTGTENKLLQIQIARDKEIEALAFLKLSNEQRYAEDVAAVTEKYRIQAEAARGYYENITLAAAAAGFKTREELQAEADNAKRLYAEMLASGQYTQTQLEAAHKKATDAQVALDGKEVLNANQKFDLIAKGASSVLKSLFGKNKAAAIAAAIADTAAAVVSTFKNAGGWPWGLIPAAAMAAEGAAQIKTIKSTDPGFAKGTPNLDFSDFGAMSWRPLHNEEAVIPRGGGHILAGEIADAMPGQDELLSLVKQMARGIDELPLEIRKAFRNAMILDMA